MIESAVIYAHSQRAISLLYKEDWRAVRRGASLNPASVEQILDHSLSSLFLFRRHLIHVLMDRRIVTSVEGVSETSVWRESMRNVLEDIFEVEEEAVSL